jgi:hypothetical protein
MADRLTSARATSAAPNYFRPFTNSATNEAFVDGGIYHNNPVRVAHRESQLLWPAAGNRLPDILLSIGTGYYSAEPGGGAADEASASADGGVGGAGSARRRGRQRPPPSNKISIFIAPRIKQVLRTLIARKSDIFNGENIWTSFLSDMRQQHVAAQPQSLQRLNVNIGYKPPALDDKAQYKKLQDAVKKGLATDAMRDEIAYVAECLIASSFYFERKGSLKETGTGYSCEGTYGGSAFTVRVYCVVASAAVIRHSVGQNLRVGVSQWRGRLGDSLFDR